LSISSITVNVAKIFADFFASLLRFKSRWIGMMKQSNHNQAK
jgi:hypothetical protein